MTQQFWLPAALAQAHTQLQSQQQQQEKGKAAVSVPPQHSQHEAVLAWLMASAGADHAVPQAPASPASTLQPPIYSPEADAEFPEAAHTPELRVPSEPQAQSPQLRWNLKRNRDAFEPLPIHPAPRTHFRKNMHPMRAAEAVADDWEIDMVGLHSRSPFVITHRAEPVQSRSTPERIHVHKKQKKAPSGFKAAAAGSTVAKECADCHTFKTPMWRKVDGVTFCNACGLRRTRAQSGR